MRIVNGKEALELMIHGSTALANGTYYRMRRNRIQQSDTVKDEDFEDSKITVNEFLSADYEM